MLSLKDKGNPMTELSVIFPDARQRIRKSPPILIISHKVKFVKNTGCFVI